jgi:hypothetical protein
MAGGIFVEQLEYILLSPIGAAHIYFDCHPRPPRRILAGILKIKLFVVSRIHQRINILFHFVVSCACPPSPWEGYT